MKNLLFIALLGLSHTLLGQDWCAEYPSALLQAKEESKPIILVFSGSDWCAPCIKLEHEIWTSEEFKKYASEHFVLYRADFPRKKTNQLSETVGGQNRKLADKFNPKGYFPLVVVLDQDEETLGTSGYENLSPNAYIELLNSFLK
ncbi:thioredoxin family protein [Allomuricauda sp. d1]|uniref:thioredoxin family protein n=1 Tax=Allomuricauda sp. d1 TaxID=3136725 RepID=UPI0031CF32C0